MLVQFRYLDWGGMYVVEVRGGAGVLYMILV